MASDKALEKGSGKEVQAQNPKHDFDILIAEILEDKRDKHLAYSGGEVITEARELKTKNGMVSFTVRSYGKSSYSSIDLTVRNSQNAIIYTGEIRYETQQGKWRFMSNDGKTPQDKSIDSTTAATLIKSFQDIFIDAKVRNEVNLRTKQLLAQNFPEVYDSVTLQA